MFKSVPMFTWQLSTGVQRSFKSTVFKELVWSDVLTRVLLLLSLPVIKWLASHEDKFKLNLCPQALLYDTKCEHFCLTTPPLTFSYGCRGFTNQPPMNQLVRASCLTAQGEENLFDMFNTWLPTKRPRLYTDFRMVQKKKWNIKVQYFYSCLMNLSCSSILEKHTENTYL